MFEIKRGEPYNEQTGEAWISEADAFKQGAELIAGEDPTPRGLQNRGRLLEHAALCLRRASAHTIGHKKSDRLEAEAERLELRAAQAYARCRDMFPHWRPTAYVQGVIDREGL